MRQDTDEKWLEDLDSLYYELPKRHKNLYFSLSKADFSESILALKRNLPRLEDSEIKVQISKIIASVGDAHTSINMSVYYLCPLEFYWFTDGIYAVNTSEADKALLYKRLTHIDGMEIEKVIETLSTIISHENESFLKSLLPKYLPAIELLYGLKIAQSFEGLTFTFQDENGKPHDCFVKSYPFKESLDKLHLNKIKIPENKLPFYRRNADQNYWQEYIEPAKTIYFNYRACREMERESVQDFGNKLMLFIETSPVEKLVIDLRNNTGGNSSLLDPFIQTLQKCIKINQAGHLFVILGRDTFSSALLNVYALKNNTNAILVGEPSGGKPNCYGEVQRFTLKNSGFVVCYSTKYYKVIEDDLMPSLFPDVEKGLTVQNYIDNEDPCLNHILTI
ncbi:MAG TPA: peptidase S41 [Desulfosporosinus sp.]